MDLDPRDDGHWHVRLGPVEKWFVMGGASLLVICTGAIYSSITGELSETRKEVQTLITQQAVANGQLATLTTQLADVPALTRQMAELRVRVDRHDEDIKELRQVRGLR